MYKLRYWIKENLNIFNCSQHLIINNLENFNPILRIIFVGNFISKLKFFVLCGRIENKLHIRRLRFE